MADSPDFGTVVALNQPSPIRRRLIMLRLALFFFILALIGLFFGFGIIANFAFGIAKICFIVFLILAVVMLLGSAFRGRPTTPL